jgi:sec-independent protein translocase protein TatB
VLDLSPDKLFMLALVALVILGPNRLPAAARTVGRFIGQIRSMSASLQSEVREALSDQDDALASALAEFRPGDVRRSVRKVVSDTISPFEAGSIRRSMTEVVGLGAPGPGPDAIALDGMASAPPAWDLRANPDDPGLN